MLDKQIINDNYKYICKLEVYKNIKNLSNKFNTKTNKQNSQKSFYIQITCLFIFNFLCLTYLSIYFYDYFNNDALNVNYFFSSLAKKLLNADKNNTAQECLVSLPDVTLNSILRPIVDCKMCSNLSSIERLEHIKKEDFLRLYAYTSVPVIIKDATVKWTAMDSFNFKFFKNLYSVDDNNLNDEFEEATCQFFRYKTSFNSLNDVFDTINDVPDIFESDYKPWYIGWSNCNQTATNIIRKHYKRPYFLPDDSEMMKTDWIFMGTPGYGANMHIDDVDYSSWQAQIKGTKKWTFQPPPECMFTCQTLYAIVEPGDVIVFDSNKWYHQTDIIGSELSLTIGSEYD